MADDISCDKYAPRSFAHATSGMSGTFGNISPGHSYTGSPPRTRDKFLVDFESVTYKPYGTKAYLAGYHKHKFNGVLNGNYLTAETNFPAEHDADTFIPGSDKGWLSGDHSFMPKLLNQYIGDLNN